MRSDAEIRRQVETRFKRWVSVLVDGGLWVAAVVGLYLYSRVQNVPAGWVDSVILVMLIWGALFALHCLHSVYTETRESLVRRAIERERQAYSLLDAYEKRKRDETGRRLMDDGELVDLNIWEEDDAQRSRDS